MNRTRILAARTALALGLSAAASLATPSDSGWSDQASVSVTVNGHAFEKVRVDAHGCTVAVRLSFEAPEKGYSDPKNKVRNYQRFRARVKFAKGEAVESRLFGNSDPGARVYDFDADTTSDGCWSKQPDKIVKLDVVGCRGRGCDVGAFE
jgi:hypothetical protein